MKKFVITICFGLGLCLASVVADAVPSVTVKTIWIDGDATKNPDLVTKSGTTRIVWDARADNPNEISSAVAVCVQAYV